MARDPLSTFDSLSGTDTNTDSDARGARSVMSRRAALGAAGVLGAGALFGGSAAAKSVSAQDGRGAGHGGASPGWNAAKGEYELPPLPYAYDALTPHIDEQTMRIHHGTHHQGYVNGLNKALTKLREIREGSGDAGLIKHWSRELSFHGAGHVNHTLFWSGMAPAGEGGGGYPSGPLAERIERDFGTFEQFAAHFKAASKAVEGSGWGWLAYEPVAGKLVVLQVEKHQDLWLSGVVPLLGVDVWEHAYYLKYQSDRGAYLDGFMRVVNWPEVQRRYEHAMA